MKNCFVLIVLCSVIALTRCVKPPFEPGDESDIRQFVLRGVDSTVTRVVALVIYSQAINDGYPFPSFELRHRIYDRISDYYDVMSYGRHQLDFREITNNGGFYKTPYQASDYKRQYNQRDPNSGVKIDGPYALYNRDVLNMVVEAHGEAVFADADIIISIATDGGPNWYVNGINGQGFGRLGIDFEAAGRKFSADYGGITIEIGSGTISELNKEIVLNWVFAHEYAHNLGFRRHRPRSVGVYSLMAPELMASTSVIENNLGPPPLDPFLLMRYGWLDKSDSTRVRTIRRGAGQVEVSLSQLRSKTGLVMVTIPLPGTEINDVAPPQFAENFFITYHRRETNIYDAAYAGSGLLIWHAVNESLLDVECAGALGNETNRDHLDINVDMGGLETDFYNSQNQFEFTPDSNPNSNFWGVYHPNLKDKPCGISITQIREDGDMVRFRVSFE